jgi:hypothetical protein
LREVEPVRATALFLGISNGMKEESGEKTTGKEVNKTKQNKMKLKSK